MDLEQGLNDAWSGIASFVPKLLGALVIFIIGWIIAKVLAKVIGRVLDRVGFNRAVERGGLRQMLGGSNLEPSDILAKLVYWAVLLFTLQFAFGVFGPNPISSLITGIISYLPNVFVAVVIMVIAGALASVARDVISNLLSGTNLGRPLGTAAYAAVLVFGAFAAIGQLRIAPSIVNALWWAVLATAVGVAVVSFGVGGIPVARRYLENLGAGGGGTQGGGIDRANVGAFHGEADTTTRDEGYEPKHTTTASREERTQEEERLREERTQAEDRLR
jgi:hypothetical protein